MNDCKTTFLFTHKQNLQGSRELSSQQYFLKNSHNISTFVIDNLQRPSRRYVLS